MTFNLDFLRHQYSFKIIAIIYKYTNLRIYQHNCVCMCVCVCVVDIKCIWYNQDWSKSKNKKDKLRTI